MLTQVCDASNKTKSKEKSKTLVDKMHNENPVEDKDYLFRDPVYDGTSFSENHKMLEYSEINIERYFEAPLV